MSTFCYIGFNALVAIFSCLIAGSYAALSTEPEENYIGCYSVTECSFSEIRQEYYAISSHRDGPGQGQDCIDFCNQDTPNKGMYSFAAMQSFHQYHVCYCFKHLLKEHKEMFLQACSECLKDCGKYFMVWQTCPVGHYDPNGGCAAECPLYCLPNPESTSAQIRCTNSGECLDGCKDNLCRNLASVQRLGSEIAYTEPHPAMFVMYTDKTIIYNGYVTKVTFSGRANGFAYVSIWSLTSVDNHDLTYVMKGKLAIHTDVAGSGEVMLQPEEYFSVSVGDVLAVHFDAYFMHKGDGTRANENFTVLNVEKSDQHAPALFSNASDLQDENWKVGKTITIDSRNEIHMDVSVLVTVDVNCPAGCRNFNCTAFLGDIICLHDCIAGYTGHNCSFVCEDGKYGPACTKTCPDSCQKCLPDSGQCSVCAAGKRGNMCDQDCEKGTWGQNCRMRCGSCYKGTVCHPVTGECSFGCNHGFKLPTCQQPCDVGTFGINCKHKCSENCWANAFGVSVSKCDTVTGACPKRFCPSRLFCTCLTADLIEPMCLCTRNSSLETCRCDQCTFGCDSDGICNIVSGHREPVCQDPFKAEPTCKCAQGTWGAACEQECGKCRDSEACNAFDGFCPAGCQPGFQAPTCTEECESGYWGEFCGNRCGVCENYAPCATSNGQCPEERCQFSNAEPPFCVTCIDGFYGDDCLSPCLGNCLDGSCDKNTGECTECNTTGLVLQLPDCKCQINTYGEDCSLSCGHCSNGCKSCNGRCVGPCLPGYQGDRCNIPCEDGYWGSGCTQRCGWCANHQSCNKMTGQCLGLCVQGYRGDKCKCTARQWGNDCTRSCGRCLYRVTCDVDTGTCPNGCAVGFYGPQCDQPCPRGKYGKNCEYSCGNCKGRYCNRRTGECPDGCQSSNMPPFCVDPCPPGKFGWNCFQHCGMCGNGTTCDSKTGRCPDDLCEDYYGPPYCINKCINTHGTGCNNRCGRCKGGLYCNVETGNCLDGCELGFEPPMCSSSCPKGKYGPNCESQCSTTCTSQACNAANGRCLFGCVGSFQPPLCTKPCAPGTWGPNCKNRCGHCAGDSGSDQLISCSAQCDLDTGSCPSGCAPGYLLPDCVNTCEAGLYGNQCEEACGFCKEGTCQPETGICDSGCKRDYLPPFCQVKFK